MPHQNKKEGERKRNTMRIEKEINQKHISTVKCRTSMRFNQLLKHFFSVQKSHSVYLYLTFTFFFLSLLNRSSVRNMWILLNNVHLSLYGKQKRKKYIQCGLKGNK